MTPKERAIRILLLILAKPHYYSRKGLAKHFKISVDSIKEYLLALENAHVNLTYETKKGQYFYAIEPDLHFKELQYLQPLSNADMTNIHRALDHIKPTDAFYLKRKIDSLYDFQKLGLNALRRPALERINHLKSAKKNKKQVILVRYRSNSNDIRDRLVEVFKIDPELDTIQAFDPNDKKIKHFKLSRIERVQLTDHPWAFQGKHDAKPTDVFRIAMGNQVLVQLKMDVYAYNSLIENFPKAKAECDTGSEPNTFEFQSKVNPQFLGLINFIMNNAGHVEIISPEELKDQVRKRINILLNDLDK
jgi:predicted DNA-binding transcriptional regulator YafY